MPISMERLTIKKVGDKNPQYFVYFDDDMPISTKRVGNNLIHYLYKDSLTIIMDSVNHILRFDTRNIFGLYDNPRFKKVAPPRSLPYAKSTERFFDFQPDIYASGIPGAFIPQIKYIPFRINPVFVQKHDITSLTLNVYYSRADTTLAPKYQTTLMFNTRGHLDRVVEKTSGHESTWKFEYRDDDHSLSKIVYDIAPSIERVFYFDRDSWLLDEFNQKKIISMLDWKYNREGMPMNVGLVTRDLESYVQYEYNKQGDLIKCVDMLGESVVGSWTYEYHNEVLARVFITN